MRGHPLQAVKQDLRAARAVRGTALEWLTAAEVAAVSGGALCRARRCRPSVARVLHRRTEGNPLFLVHDGGRTACSRGCVARRRGSGRCRGAGGGRAAVPESLRQMIEQQFDAPQPGGSSGCWRRPVWWGRRFRRRPWPPGLDWTVEAVEARCAGLARRASSCEASGVESLAGRDGGGAVRLSACAVSGGGLRRGCRWGGACGCIGSIGTRLEAGYGAQARAHAAELALHFERGRDPARAVQYLQQAAENALRRYALSGGHRHSHAGADAAGHAPRDPGSGRSRSSTCSSPWGRR